MSLEAAHAPNDVATSFLSRDVQNIPNHTRPHTSPFADERVQQADLASRPRENNLSQYPSHCISQPPPGDVLVSDPPAIVTTAAKRKTKKRKTKSTPSSPDYTCIDQPTDSHSSINERHNGNLLESGASDSSADPDPGPSDVSRPSTQPQTQTPSKKTRPPRATKRKGIAGHETCQTCGSCISSSSAKRARKALSLLLSLRGVDVDSDPLDTDSNSQPRLSIPDASTLLIQRLTSINPSLKYEGDLVKVETVHERICGVICQYPVLERFSFNPNCDTSYGFDPSYGYKFNGKCGGGGGGGGCGCKERRTIEALFCNCGDCLDKLGLVGKKKGREIEVDNFFHLWRRYGMRCEVEELVPFEEGKKEDLERDLERAFWHGVVNGFERRASSMKS